jgi:hypothetical protein
MRVVRQALRHVRRVTLERIGPRGLALPGRAVPVQVRADRLRITAHAPSDRTDRQALPAERMRVHVFLLRDHGGGPLRDGVWSETAILEGAHPVTGMTRRVGNFNEQN